MNICDIVYFSLLSPSLRKSWFSNIKFKWAIAFHTIIQIIIIELKIFSYFSWLVWYAITEFTTKDSWENAGIKLRPSKMCSISHHRLAVAFSHYLSLSFYRFRQQQKITKSTHSDCCFQQNHQQEPNILQWNVVARMDSVRWKQWKNEWRK